MRAASFCLGIIIHLLGVFKERKRVHYSALGFVPSDLPGHRPIYQLSSACRYKMHLEMVSEGNSAGLIDVERSSAVNFTFRVMVRKFKIVLCSEVCHTDMSYRYITQAVIQTCPTGSHTGISHRHDIFEVFQAGNN